MSIKSTFRPPIAAKSSPGLDLEIRGDNGRLKLQLVSHSRSGSVTVANNSLQAVRLKVEGANRVKIDDAGRLRLATPAGETALPLLQAVNAAGRPLVASPGPAEVNAAGEITNPFTSSEPGNRPATGAAAAAAGDEPVLFFSTFLEGSDSDNAAAIAVDEAGSAYVTGGTTSTDFPTTPGAFDPESDPGLFQDVYIARFNPQATRSRRNLRRSMLETQTKTILGWEEYVYQFASGE